MSFDGVAARTALRPSASVAGDRWLWPLSGSDDLTIHGNALVRSTKRPTSSALRVSPSDALESRNQLGVGFEDDEGKFAQERRKRRLRGRSDRLPDEFAEAVEVVGRQVVAGVRLEHVEGD